MKKVWMLGAALLTLTAPLTGQAAWPERDVSVIVPYPAGGGTDLTVRIITNEMAEILGINMPVTNKPGASGSVGTVETWNKPHDGYTIVGNGMLAFANYPVLGYHDKTWKDWHIWIATYSPNIVVTKAGNDKYKSMADVVADMKARPGKVTVGAAGVGTGGHLGMEVLKSGAGVTYKLVPYEGGAKAITAGLSGEVDLLVQLSMEELDHIKAGKFKALGALSDGPFKTAGTADIPSVAVEIPEMAPLLPMGESFGFMVPKDTPAEIVKKIDDAFHAAMKSEKLKKFADDKGVALLGLSGDEAQAHVAKLASIVSWIWYDGSIAKKSPEQFDIPRFTK